MPNIKMKTNLNGQWKGKVIYGPDYGELENKELYFSVDITQNLDTFTGIALDTGGVGANPNKAAINGFVDGNEISFVMQYSSTARFDENNKVVIEKDKPSPEINYWGTFDPLTNVIEGNWEIVINSEQIGYGYLDDIATGSFSMRKV